MDTFGYGLSSFTLQQEITELKITGTSSLDKKQVRMFATCILCACNHYVLVTIMCSSWKGNSKKGWGQEEEVTDEGTLQGSEYEVQNSSRTL